MSKKILSASYERHEYEEDVFTEAIVYTKRVPQNTATKITNAGLSTFVLAANFGTTDTRLQFKTLVGNLPWSSYSKFAYTQPRTTSPSIPLASLPKSGSIVLAEAGKASETIYYGSITWVSATTGYLNNVKRGATPVAYTTDNCTGTFTNVIPVREYIKIWNRSGAVLWIGANAAIDATPTNAVKLADAGEWGMWLEPLQELWVFSADATADINIAEYR